VVNGDNVVNVVPAYAKASAGKNVEQMTDLGMRQISLFLPPNLFPFFQPKTFHEN